MSLKNQRTYRILRNDANKYSCFQTDDAFVGAKNEGPTHPRVHFPRAQPKPAATPYVIPPAMANGTLQ